MSGPECNVCCALDEAGTWCLTALGSEGQALWGLIILIIFCSPLDRMSVENSLGTWRFLKLQKNKSGWLAYLSPCQHFFFFLLPRLESVPFQKRHSFLANPHPHWGMGSSSRAVWVCGEVEFCRLHWLTDSTESNFKSSIYHSLRPIDGVQ